MSSEVRDIYEFGKFRFDGGTHRLWHGDELILLSPKAAKLLRMLLERRGEFVSKQEIFDSVWAETFVEDGVLTQNIYTLRKVLGNGADGLPIIENKTRLGYRITIPVNVSGNGKIASETNGQIIQDSAANKSHSTSIQPPSRKKRSAIFALGVVLLLTAGTFGWRFFRPQIAAFFRKPIENVHFQSLTTTGNIWHPTLSPDGNFAAFVRNNEAYLEDIASSKEIKLAIPNVTSFSALQFSPDGNFIFFRPHYAFRKDASVLQVSRFGGETRLVAERTWGSFGISNDGKQIAFVRNIAEQAKQVLTIRKLESGEEHELTTVDFPEMFLFSSAPAWSPDDRKIAFVVQNVFARRTSLFMIDPENRQKEEIKIPRLRQFEQIAWLPDGESLIASANEGGKFFQLWKIFFHDGDAQRITNGLSTYGKISVSADGKKLLALQTAESSNLFVASADDLSVQKQVTFGNANNVGQSGLEWAGEDRLIFVAYSEENPVANLWKINLADNSPGQPLTTSTAFNSDSPSVAADGKYVYFTTSQSPIVNVWRMDLNGGNLTQITDGKDGWRMFPRISRDGNLLYYIFRSREGGVVKRLNVLEKTEETLFEKEAANPLSILSLADDDSGLAFLNWSNKVGGDDDKTNFQFGFASMAIPGEVKVFDVKILSQAMQMTTDGQAFDYVSWDGDKTMILRQRIEGGEPQEILALPKTRIFNFAWSRSRQLAMSHGRQSKDAVLLTDFE